MSRPSGEIEVAARIDDALFDVRPGPERVGQIR
jgi:hypothetical protein